MSQTCKGCKPPVIPSLEPLVPNHRGPERETLEPTMSKLKIPDPSIFWNDGNPTWENWHKDMKIKLDCDTNRNEKEMVSYVL